MIDGEDDRERIGLVAKVGLAHFAGLTFTGFYGSVGTTAGFGSGAGVSIFLGGVLSVPWLAVVLLVIWFVRTWTWQRLSALLVLGPVLTCGSYAVLLGGFVELVAVSCTVSSVVLAILLMISAWRRRRTAIATHA